MFLLVTMFILQADGSQKEEVATYTVYDQFNREQSVALSTRVLLRVYNC